MAGYWKRIARRCIKISWRPKGGFELQPQTTAYGPELLWCPLFFHSHRIKECNLPIMCYVDQACASSHSIKMKRQLLLCFNASYPHGPAKTCMGVHSTTVWRSASMHLLTSSTTPLLSYSSHHSENSSLEKANTCMNGNN